MLLETDVRMHTGNYIRGQYWKNGWKNTEIKQERRQNIKRNKEKPRKSQGRVQEEPRKSRGRVEEESRKSRGRIKGRAEEGSTKSRGRAEEESRNSRGRVEEESGKKRGKESEKTKLFLDNVSCFQLVWIAFFKKIKHNKGSRWEMWGESAVLICF